MDGREYVPGFSVKSVDTTVTGPYDAQPNAEVETGFPNATACAWEPVMVLQLWTSITDM
jgi:hypothetical protein